jgi:hypothetical protein
MQEGLRQAARQVREEEAASSQTSSPAKAPSKRRQFGRPSGDGGLIAMPQETHEQRSERVRSARLRSRTAVVACLISGVTAIALCIGASSAAANSVHLYETTWNTAAGSQPSPQAVDAAGNVYVYNMGFRTVTRHDPNGNPVPFSALGTNTIDGEGGGNCPSVPADCDRVPLGDLMAPEGFAAVVPTIAVDTTSGPTSGYIYVENDGTPEGRNAQIEVFAPSGKYIGEINTNTDGPQHVGHNPAGVNVDQHGNVYVFSKTGSGILDKFVPIDANPAHDVFGGQIRARVLIAGQSNEYTIGANDAAGGDPLSVAVLPGGYPPAYPYGPIYAYENEQYLTVNRENPAGWMSDFIPERLFGYGANLIGNQGWRNVTLDPSTGHIYLQSGGEVTEWDGKGNEVGNLFGPPHTGGYWETQKMAVDGSNQPTKGRVYIRGASNGEDSVAVFSPPEPTPDIEYGSREVGHETAHIEGTIKLAGGPPVTNCKLEWGTTGGFPGGFQEPVPAFERVPIPCDAATPYNSDTAVTIDMENLPTEQLIHYRFVATNANGPSYGKTQEIQPHAVSSMTTEPATEILPNSAVLNARMDPDGMATTYWFEYGLDKDYNVKTQKLGAGSGSGIISVPGIEIDKLQPGTIYHYRAVAENALGVTYGQDRIFTAAATPKISSVRSRNLTATSVDVYADINPVGSETKYHFEYGPSVAYGTTTPEQELGPDLTNQPVTAHLDGLQPGVGYHFRLVATNSAGTTYSEDTTFNFFPPACPNSHVRQQTGSNYLPDCRAYELVTPETAGGMYIVPSDTLFDWGRRYGAGETQQFRTPSQNSGLANNPSRFNYYGALGGLNGLNTPNITSDMYVSTRTNEGWVSSYPGPFADEIFATGRGQCSIAMDKCLVRSATVGLGDEDAEGSNAPRLYDVSGQFLGRLPTNVDTIKGGRAFNGYGRASGDFSHFIFTSRDVPFAPGGAESPPGTVYDNDIDQDTVEIISKLPNGEPIPQDPLNAGDPSDYLDVPFISRDASRILIGARSEIRCTGISAFYCDPNCFGCTDLQPNPAVTLYMRVAGTTLEVSRGKRVHLADVSGDGARVYFTSPEAFLPADEDTSEDLYRWDLASDSFTLLSLGGEDTGNSDDCDVSWTDGCGIVQLRSCGLTGIWNLDPCEARAWGYPTERPDIDSGTARENGATLFYSPEQLDPSNPGVPNARNLYLYRDGQVQYVTTFPPGTEAQRYNITSDGAHVAFVTTAQLTSYDNTAGPKAYCQVSNDNEKGTVNVPCREVYAYDAESGLLRCVSCNPEGTPPRGDAFASTGGPFMADDGRVFFSTRDALVPADTDGLYSVYEYVDGRPQLISTGVSVQDAFPGLLNIGFGPFWDPAVAGLESVSSDGKDVFFSTYDTLVPQDHNGQFLKIYDARTNGGIPFEVPLLPCTAADECHDPTNGAPRDPEVGSGAELSGGNVQPAKKKRVTKKHRKRHKKKHRRRGRKHRATAGTHRSGRHG